MYNLNVLNWFLHHKDFKLLSLKKKKNAWFYLNALILFYDYHCIINFKFCVNATQKLWTPLIVNSLCLSNWYMLVQCVTVSTALSQCGQWKVSTFGRKLTCATQSRHELFSDWRSKASIIYQHQGQMHKQIYSRHVSSKTLRCLLCSL